MCFCEDIDFISPGKSYAILHQGQGFRRREHSDEGSVPWNVKPQPDNGFHAETMTDGVGHPICLTFSREGLSECTSGYWGKELTNSRLSGNDDRARYPCRWVLQADYKCMPFTAEIVNPNIILSTLKLRRVELDAKIDQYRVWLICRVSNIWIIAGKVDDRPRA